MIFVLLLNVILKNATQKRARGYHAKTMASASPMIMWITATAQRAGQEQTVKQASTSVTSVFSCIIKTKLLQYKYYHLSPMQVVVHVSVKPFAVTAANY